MALFKCKVKSNYGKSGDVVDVKGVEHDKLSNRQAQLLTPHKEAKPKVIGELSASDIVKAIKSAESIEEIEAYSEDDRKTVKEAFEAKLAELTES